MREPEVVAADLLRTLYRLGLFPTRMDFEFIIDRLTIKLLLRQTDKQ